jgi:hypothetical protein
MELYELWINNCMHFGLDCINFRLSILCTLYEMAGKRWRERGYEREKRGLNEILPKLLPFGSKHP